jgi:hypothetical protein
MFAQTAMLLVLATNQSLTLPQPRVLPCQRFQTVELEVGKNTDSLADDPSASVTWQAGGRAWSFAAHLWAQPPAPLGSAALPERAELVSARPIGAARLTFHCRAYDPKDVGQQRHDADTFVGVRWTCTTGGCVPEVGHPFPDGLAASSRRLRLCVGEPARDAKGGKTDHASTRSCRDVAPAFADREKALALGNEILADARRTVEDACRHSGVCSLRRRQLATLLRPAHWVPTDWSGQRAGLKLSAMTEDRKGHDEGTLELECTGPRCSLTLRDRDGERLLTYTPIDARQAPAEALLWILQRPVVVLTAAPTDPGDHDPPGCSVAGPLLDVK